MLPKLLGANATLVPKPLGAKIAWAQLRAADEATARAWKLELERTIAKADEAAALLRQLRSALLARGRWAMVRPTAAAVDFQTLDGVLRRCLAAG